MNNVNLVKPLFQRVVIVPGFMDLNPKLEAYKHYIQSKTTKNVFSTIEIHSWIENIVLFCKKIFSLMGIQK